MLQSLNIRDKRERQEIVEHGESISTSHDNPQSSSRDQESEEAELIRSIINNHLVSFILLNKH